MTNVLRDQLLCPRGGANVGACPNGCCIELESLREENALLRSSSRSFGDLAERLNVQLQRERTRSGARWLPVEWLRRRRRHLDRH